jgi:hypothetical protein
MGRLELWAKASELIEICHKVGCGNVGGWNSARLRRERNRNRAGGFGMQVRQRVAEF